MIQPQTQTRDYWVSNFTLQESDIEFLYNHLLEVEQPQEIGGLARAVMENRVSSEIQDVKRRLAGRTVYQPRKQYQVGEQIIFPAMKFVAGEVTAVRPGYNPEYGSFDVVAVDIAGKIREFAASLPADHTLNQDNGDLFDLVDNIDLDDLFAQYGDVVVEKLTAALTAHPEFVRLGKLWLVKGLLTDINIGHLHLAEAVLEINNGGPLPTAEILTYLDLDPSDNREAQIFSLNYGLLHDNRFDEVAPRGQIAWFLRRMEPEGVRETPGRLAYKSIPYDRALLSPQLIHLERELDDEWSDLSSPAIPAAEVRLTLTYPHWWAGTLPLNANTRPLLPLGLSPRQSVQLVDEFTNQVIDSWVVQPGRYIFGLKEWYEEQQIPVGAYISLKRSPEPGVLLVNYDRRREKREWVRLATVEDNQLKFDLDRRLIGADYDDLMIVGTDYVAAVDALWRRADAHQRQLSSLLAEIVPELARMNPQNTVHAKTIYSVINMLRRVPPGPVFAELVRHPAFRNMGDHYWQFDASRWQRK